MNGDDPKYARLDERLKGMAASTAILNETAKQERARLRDSLEAQRRSIQDVDKRLQRVATKSDITELKMEVSSIKQHQASSTQVRVALIGTAGAIVAAAIALLKVLLGG